MTRTAVGQKLPGFPWDSLADVRALAQSHPDGLVDLSVGSPVDKVSPTIQLALVEAAPEPGYPATAGTPELRRAIRQAMERRYSITQVSDRGVLPVIGTKEAIAWLPFLLGCTGTVVIPTVAYPTYEVAARLAGCDIVLADHPVEIPNPADVDLMFINSPSNPTGRVASIEELRELVSFAREHNIVLASDECYLGLIWDDSVDAASILDPRVCDGDHHNLIAIHSLSKTSSLASYRAGYLLGDEQLIQDLLLVRKHAGLMVPGPVQAAMVAALDNDEQEDWQRVVYAQRRATLMRAVLAAGLRVEHSEAGLYLWATQGDEVDGRDTVRWFAERGILVAPGDFYGTEGKNHVRIALTATDERIDAAVKRLQEDAAQGEIEGN